VNIGGLGDGDFVQGAAVKAAPLTERDRDTADRAAYVTELRKELREVKFQQMYGWSKENYLGARRPN